MEEWSNRLVISELWVDEKLRRQGTAAALMSLALKRADGEGRRAVMLETQSCNVAAISFYLKCGFTLMGFDACAYQNDDLQRGEVRIELGILLP